jgi:hypothetical protein
MGKPTQYGPNASRFSDPVSGRMTFPPVLKTRLPCEGVDRGGRLTKPGAGFSRVRYRG